MKINIAIDGPSAAGKSTIAKSLAKQLNYIHLDTGAMYRSTAYKAVCSQISLEDENALVEMLKNTDIKLTPEGKVFLDGEDVSSSIRTDQISLAASSVSRHPLVRSELVARQQKMAEKKGFIMDGRDIGTVVLPNADYKFYIIASVEERARRRYLELESKGIHQEYDELVKDIEARDYQDRTRKIAPLRKADDAILIDTDNLNEKEVFEKIIGIIGK